MSDEVAFGSERPYSVGIEEELFLVDPRSGVLANASAAVIERLGSLAGRAERELHACQVELISPVSTTVVEAVATLRSMRGEVRATGAGLLGSGIHPAAGETAAEITDKSRYERIRELLGDAVVTAVSGLHVHVGMEDADSAIRAFNGLREHLPLLQALSANSPFRHGRDTGLASAREVTLRGWPRSGVPRALGSFSDFEALAALMGRAAGVPDYTWFWWKLRPHPRLGTVEVRSLDAQTTSEETAGLAALVHCLGHHWAQRPTPSPSPPELIEEGLFRAARFGTASELPDAQGRPQPLRDVLAQTLELCADDATQLGCARELETLPGLAARGGGAGRQREIHAISGMDTLLHELVCLTAAPPGE